MLFSATINLRIIIFIMKAEIFVRYESEVALFFSCNSKFEQRDIVTL